MEKGFVVNTTRPLSQLSDEVHKIYERQTDMSRALLGGGGPGGHWYWLEDGEHRKFLMVKLALSERLKISYEPEGHYHVQFQKKNSDKEWVSTEERFMDPRTVVSQMDSVMTNALDKNKQRNKFRFGLAAAALAGGLLVTCGKSKAEELPQIPDQDQPVAAQRHLEP